MPEGPVLLLALLTDDGCLHLHRAPHWSTAVEERDRGYFAELWPDLQLRAAVDPDVLFAQLGSLSVGPLICTGSGDDLRRQPHLFALVHDFVAL